MNGELHNESDYEDISRLGAKLGIPVPMMHLGVEVKNPDGTIVQHYNGRSHTWVRNFWNYMIASMAGVSTGTAYGVGTLGLKQTNGDVGNFNFYDGNAYPYLFNLQGNQNQTCGIVVGRGTTAESFEHSAMESIIPAGSNSTSLIFTQNHTIIPTYSNNKWTVTIVRQFNGNATAPITVTETGIIYRNANDYKLLVCRDLLASAVVVPVNAQLTVTYQLTLTFPA